MTGDEVIVVELAPFGRFRLAAILREGTARVELTARRRVYRARNFALKLGRRFFRIRVEVGNSREQRLGIGMERRRKQFFGRRDLDDLAEIHDRNMVARVRHDGEVVGYEKKRKPQFLL